MTADTPARQPQHAQEVEWLASELRFTGAGGVGTMDEIAGQFGGEIGLEHATLRGEAAGAETRYTVSLSRTADARWVGAFRQLQAEMPQHRRFQLAPGGAALAFSCRSVEGPSGVFEMLQRAESLLEMLGRRLEAAAPHDPVPTRPSIRTVA